MLSAISCGGLPCRSPRTSRRQSASRATTTVRASSPLPAVRQWSAAPSSPCRPGCAADRPCAWRVARHRARPRSRPRPRPASQSRPAQADLSGALNLRKFPAVRSRMPSCAHRDRSLAHRDQTAPRPDRATAPRDQTTPRRDRIAARLHQIRERCPSLAGQPRANPRGPQPIRCAPSTECDGPGDHLETPPRPSRRPCATKSRRAPGRKVGRGTKSVAHRDPKTAHATKCARTPGAKGAGAHESSALATRAPRAHGAVA